MFRSLCLPAKVGIAMEIVVVQKAAEEIRLGFTTVRGGSVGVVC